MTNIVSVLNLLSHWSVWRECWFTDLSGTPRNRGDGFRRFIELPRRVRSQYRYLTLNDKACFLQVSRAGALFKIVFDPVI